MLYHTLRIVWGSKYLARSGLGLQHRAFQKPVSPYWGRDLLMPSIQLIVNAMEWTASVSHLPHVIVFKKFSLIFILLCQYPFKIAFDLYNVSTSILYWYHTNVTPQSTFFFFFNFPSDFCTVLGPIFPCWWLDILPLCPNCCCQRTQGEGVESHRWPV